MCCFRPSAVLPSPSLQFGQVQATRRNLRLLPPGLTFTEAAAAALVAAMFTLSVSCEASAGWTCTWIAAFPFVAFEGAAITLTVPAESHLLGSVLSCVSIICPWGVLVTWTYAGFCVAFSDGSVCCWVAIMEIPTSLFPVYVGEDTTYWCEGLLEFFAQDKGFPCHHCVPMVPLLSSVSDFKLHGPESTAFVKSYSGA